MGKEVGKERRTLTFLLAVGLVVVDKQPLVGQLQIRNLLLAGTLGVPIGE
jgi:hypothetical protein